jgi:hypothetical protein
LSLKQHSNNYQKEMTMKKFATLALILGLSVYSIGCSKAPEEPTTTDPAAPKTAAPADADATTEDAGTTESGSGTTN